MHTTEEQAWDRSDLYEEIQREDVADLRADRQERVVEITIRDVDLPWELSLGHVIVAGTPEDLLEAVGEAISAIKCCMEIGVPGERRAALPLVGIRRAVHRALLALARMVRSGGQR